MGALSRFFSQLYEIILIFFYLLALQVVNLFRFITVIKPTSETRVIITNEEYLNLIEKINPAVSYSTQENINKKNLKVCHECSVCLSEFEDGDKMRELKCKHRFHMECVDKWLQPNCATCPLCREKVVPDDIAAASDEEVVSLSSSSQDNSFHRSDIFDFVVVH